MTLPMTRPTKNAKTGTYLVRVGIPSDLRDSAQAMFGVRWELRENLGTRDAAEARRRAPAALARLRAMLDRVRGGVEEGPEEPGARDTAALAGHWYRRRVGANHPDDKIRDFHMEIAIELRGSDALPGPAMLPYASKTAEHLLRETGYAVSEDSVARLVPLLERAAAKAAATINARAEGDWSPDTNLTKFPELPRRDLASTDGVGGCPFDTLVAGWALDRGMKVGTTPVPRALYDRQRTSGRLAAFLGHRDADRVAKADVVRWKEEALRRGLAATTVRNDISEMTAVWDWGFRNAKLRPAENPFRGTLPPKATKKSRDPRAFTDAEAALILEAARTKRGFMRWLPWVLCLTGARLNEICQADKTDVVTLDGVVVIRIHDEGAGRSVKNADSRRTVPLHPALIAEGFLDYVAALPAGAPLWPDVSRDGVFGQRSVIAGRQLGRWLRTDLDIGDPNISPNHSWRHWFIGACRRVAMPVEVRSAITGHSAKMDESAAYGDAMGSFVRVVAGYLEKVACPAKLSSGTGGDPP